MEKRFEEVEHTADIALHVWGRDLSELFANAAYGMASQLTDIEDVVLTDEQEIGLEAKDTEILLVDWLSELLYRGERKHHVYVDFEMQKVTEKELQAIARGGPVKAYHRGIKAVTFSELEVVQTENGYETTVVFDV
ncbi:MAG: archease [Chloroflexota bacterium]|nr:archease [Chloroflexota bacterium]